MLTIWTDIERRSEWRFFIQRWSEHPAKKHIIQLYKDYQRYYQTHKSIKTNWSMLNWLMQEKETIPYSFFVTCCQMYGSDIEYKNINNLADWYIQSFFVSDEINIEQLSQLSLSHIEGFNPYELGWICSYILLLQQKKYERKRSYAFWYDSVLFEEENLQIPYTTPSLWPYIPDTKKDIWHKHWQFYSKKEVLNFLQPGCSWFNESDLPHILNDWLQEFNEKEVNIYI